MQPLNNRKQTFFFLAVLFHTGNIFITSSEVSEKEPAGMFCGYHDQLVKFTGKQVLLS